MTSNRDKINAMTNEELANLLTNEVCPCYIYKNIQCELDDDCECMFGVIKWLNQESEEQ